LGQPLINAFGLKLILKETLCYVSNTGFPETKTYLETKHQ